MLYFMIVGRWLLPRGTISRNELSQLLFVFIGIASDITEFFTLFDEDVVRKNLELTYAILIIWTVSLLQFCFVLTATRNSNKPRVALINPEAESPQNSQTKKKKGGCEKCVSSEVWSTLVTMFMQDGPFLTIRLFVIITYHLVNYAIIFFTAKNALVMLLLLYRLVVICSQKNPENVPTMLDFSISVTDPVSVSEYIVPSPVPSNSLSSLQAISSKEKSPVPRRNNDRSNRKPQTNSGEKYKTGKAN